MNKLRRPLWSPEFDAEVQFLQGSYEIVFLALNIVLLVRMNTLPRFISNNRS